jgi:hypothetical protein
VSPSPEPALLWHYTDANGLNGILSSRKLRLGHARFLNDQTELDFGLQTVCSVLAAQRERFGKLGMDATYIAEKVRERLIKHDVYVFACSERSDAISQWNLYGAGGYGYGLGFDFADIVKWGPRSKPLELRKIIYTPFEQRSVVESVVEEGLLIAYGRIVSAETREHAEYLASILTEELVEALCGSCATIKNPDFTDEVEWRLVRTVSEFTAAAEPVVSIPRDNYLKPCIDVSIAANWRSTALDSELPIRAVICGPRLQEGRAVTAVERALRIHGFNGVDVSFSRLAWR